MSFVAINEQNLQDIADAIRFKNGTENTYKPNQMAAAIGNIPLPISKLPSVIDGSVINITAEDLSGATEIGNYAFYNCTSLTSITIPNSVTSIGNSAFASCSSLTYMTVLSITPPTLVNTNAIPNNVQTIYIPNGTLSVYQGATNWSSFSGRFVELPA